MNISKMLFIGFIVISGCVSNSIMAADMPEGSIKLSAEADGGGKSCVLKIRETSAMQIFKMKDTTCTNDEARYFALDNVPSATRIRFDGAPCGTHRDQFAFLIKTIIHPISTRRINLRELKDSTEGSIVVAGVVLVEKKYESDYGDGKLSCVLVWRSATP